MYREAHITVGAEGSVLSHDLTVFVTSSEQCNVDFWESCANWTRLGSFEHSAPGPVSPYVTGEKQP